MGAKGLELLQLGKRSGVWLKPSLTEAELEALARGKKVIEAGAGIFFSWPCQMQE